MRFRVPVMFNAEVVHKAKRNPVPEPLVEWHDVEVREADCLDAPKATEWRTESGDVMSTRWFEGSHWMPYTATDQDTDERHFLSAGEMAVHLAEGRRFGNPLAVGTDWVLREFAEGKRKAYDPSDFRKIAVSDRESVLAKAERQAESCLVVDGMVLIRSTEPVYVIERQMIDRKGGTPVLRPKVVPLSEARDPVDMFRADRFDDMAEEAKSRYGDALSVDRASEITVFLPESLGYDDERAALFTGIDDVLQSQKRFLATAELRDVRAWLETSESLAAARRDWNEENAAALQAAAETYIAVSLAGDYFGDKLRKTLDRWSVRPIGDEFDDGAVLKTY